MNQGYQIDTQQEYENGGDNNMVCVWYEAIDPNTNKTYYVNTQTNAVQWDKPDDFDGFPMEYANATTSAVAESDAKERVEYTPSSEASTNPKRPKSSYSIAI